MKDHPRFSIHLCAGAALLLIWAGLIEAFISQYHQPVLPYSWKISFGLIELISLSWFFARAGRKPRKDSKD